LFSGHKVSSFCTFVSVEAVKDIEKSEIGICLSLTPNEKARTIYGLAETIFKNDLKKQINLGTGELNVIWKKATPLKIAKLRI